MRAKVPLAAFLLLTTVSFLAPASANAAAIYTWVNAAGTAGVGTLTLSDEAYFAGGTSGSITPYEGKIWYDPNGGQQGTIVDTAPVMVDVWIPTPGAGLNIDIGPPWNPFVPPDGPPNPDLFFQFALTVVGDGLAGFLRYDDGNANAGMSGTASVWSNFHATTDLYPDQCRSDEVDACDQLSGRWVLTSAPTQSVPEPFGVALMILGLAGLGLRAHRKW